MPETPEEENGTKDPESDIKATPENPESETEHEESDPRSDQSSSFSKILYPCMAIVILIVIISLVLILLMSIDIPRFQEPEVTPEPSSTSTDTATPEISNVSPRIVFSERQTAYRAFDPTERLELESPDRPIPTNEELDLIGQIAREGNVLPWYLVAIDNFPEGILVRPQSGTFFITGTPVLITLTDTPTPTWTPTPTPTQTDTPIPTETHTPTPTPTQTDTPPPTETHTPTPPPTETHTPTPSPTETHTPPPTPTETHTPLPTPTKTHTPTPIPESDVLMPEINNPVWLKKTTLPTDAAGTALRWYVRLTAGQQISIIPYTASFEPQLRMYNRETETELTFAGGRTTLIGLDTIDDNARRLSIPADGTGIYVVEITAAEAGEDLTDAEYRFRLAIVRNTD